VNQRRLESFVAVARRGSFTDAAADLHLSQSAVSQQISALEHELNAQLFDRSRRRVALTPAGAALLERAERLLQDSEAARRAVGAAQGLIAGALDIAASLTIAAYLLPESLALLAREHPEVRASVRIENTERVVRSLLADEVDLGFVEGDVSAEGIRIEELHIDELVVIVPPEHRLSSLPTVEPVDLAAEPFVVRERGSGTQRIAESALARAGIDTSRLRVVAQLSGIDAIKAAVEVGLGVAIVSALAVRREVDHGTLVALRVSGTPMDRRLAAAFAAGRAVMPAARELVQLIRAANLPPRVRHQRETRLSDRPQLD
jgi:DNA-binding transcriptional LysR family regulator